MMKIRGPCCACNHPMCLCDQDFHVSTCISQTSQRLVIHFMPWILNWNFINDVRNMMKSLPKQDTKIWPWPVLKINVCSIFLFLPATEVLYVWGADRIGRRGDEGREGVRGGRRDKRGKEEGRRRWAEGGRRVWTIGKRGMEKAENFVRTALWREEGDKGREEGETNIPACPPPYMPGIVHLQVLSRDEMSAVGKISRQWPGLARSFFTDADIFGVTCMFFT